MCQLCDCLVTVDRWCNPPVSRDWPASVYLLSDVRDPKKFQIWLIIIANCIMSCTRTGSLTGITTVVDKEKSLKLKKKNYRHQTTKGWSSQTPEWILIWAGDCFIVCEFNFQEEECDIILSKVTYYHFKSLSLTPRLHTHLVNMEVRYLQELVPIFCHFWDLNAQL